MKGASTMVMALKAQSMVGAAPNREVFDEGLADREEFANRAGQLMGMAAESFADGLRAYYMSFAVIAWFISTGLFALCTLAVLWVLYRREFRSDVSVVLKADAPISSAAVAHQRTSRPQP